MGEQKNLISYLEVTSSNMAMMENDEQNQESNAKVLEITDETLWKTFQLTLCSKARRFPDNRIYATININPESARKLIDNFQIFVDGNIRGEVPGTTRDISVEGFDVAETEGTELTIQAIPRDDDGRKAEKRSESHEFRFTREVFSLSPTVKFERNEEKQGITTEITWYHLNNENIHEYVVCLDEKEIVYIYREDIRFEIRLRIAALQMGKDYSLQIKAKLENGNIIYQSEPHCFTTPKGVPNDNKPFISVSEKSLPLKLLAVLDTTDGAKAEVERETTNDRFRMRAFELLKLMEEQLITRNLNG